MSATTPEQEREKLENDLLDILIKAIDDEKIKTYGEQSNGIVTWVGKSISNDFVSELAKFVLQRDAQTAKAFGGCTNCYGKGYATTNEYASARGHKWRIAGPMKFCTCDRGKQLHELFEERDAQREAEIQEKYEESYYRGMSYATNILCEHDKKTTLKILLQKFQ